MLPASIPADKSLWAGAIEQYFEIALYLMVLAGFGTLAATGGLDTPTVALAGAALLFRGYLLLTGRRMLLPVSWTNFLILGYVSFFLLDYFAISGLFVQSVVHLVIFLMVVRVFSARRDRDNYFLAVLGFLMVLSAALLTVGSVFLLGFSFFLLSAVATFILLEMKHSSRQAVFHLRPGGNHGGHRRMALALARSAPVIVCLILAGAAALFFALPRVSGGYLSAYAPSGAFSTGFSDHVDLGAIGQIQQSAAVVMHIAIDGDHDGDHNLKWRGVTLSRFDGRSWTNPYRAERVLPSFRGQFDLRPGYSRARPATAASIHYRVLMEPIGTEVFFLAARPQILQGNYRIIGRDYGEAVFNWDGSNPVSVYEAWSDIRQPSAAQLRRAGANYPQGFEEFLQLPDLDARIAQLAFQITASSSTNYDRAVALEEYLSTHFVYTLQLPRTPPHDPIASFLFERKRGHCEYFASAMAVMLRSLKIPSRVVNGFQSGEFNDLTGQYVVRASQAHSWVEAYFPGYGWISFDPTPPSGADAGAGWGRLGLYMDAMASFWREWIVNYDVGHQSVAGRIAVTQGRLWLAGISDWSRRHYAELLAAARRAGNMFSQAPGRWGVRSGLLLALLLVFFNGRRAVRAFREWRLAERPESSPRLSATLWYERLLGWARRRGWKKSPAQSAQEFARSIQDPELREKILGFTKRYESARFGESVEDAGALPGLYRAIVTTARR
jgi:transglutaminase-like putative cysteine protease